jgi:hypothetical protein
MAFDLSRRNSARDRRGLLAGDSLWFRRSCKPVSARRRHALEVVDILSTPGYKYDIAFSLAEAKELPTASGCAPWYRR